MGHLNRCIIYSVDRGDTVMGYIWAHPIESNPPIPGVLDCHILIAPEYRGTWATRKTLTDLWDAARVHGADGLMACVPLPRHQRFALKAGFELDGAFAVKDLTQEGKHNNDGISATQSASDQSDDLQPDPGTRGPGCSPGDKDGSP